MVESGDGVIKERASKPHEVELRQQIWNKEKNMFEFVRYKGKKDKEFYKVFKKTFDMELKLSKPTSVVRYFDKKTNQEVKVDDEDIVIIPLGAKKVKDIAKALLSDYEVPLRTNADGTISEEFDWEDNIIGELKDKFLKIRVVGKEKRLVNGVERLVTQYEFKQGKEFKDSLDEDFPPVKTKEHEIRIEDIPFS